MRGREGNGTPLQYSCLENLMDGGAWWAAVYGVAQSWTRLKGLSSSSRYERRQQGEVFSWNKRLVRQVWSRDLLTYKAWSSNSTLSSLLMESWLDLGKSLPRTAGHNGHEMPPKHGQICGSEGTLLTGSWHLPAVSTKITSWPLQDADLERSSGWRSEIRHSVLWKKPTRTGLQIVRCFQVKILWAQILAPSHT